MADNNTNIAEAICETAKIISESVVKGVAYDKTLTCTITNADNKDEGEYTVTDGSVTFKAYSEVTNYTVNTVVYVTIPQGDYKQLKIIIGKKADEENLLPFVYLSPFDTFVDFTDNLVENEDSFSLIANCPERESVVIYLVGGLYPTQEIKDARTGLAKLFSSGEIATEEEYKQKKVESDESLTKSLLSYDASFTRLGIKGGFKSFVNEAIYGEYGFRVTILDKICLTTAEKVDDWLAREHVYYLTSSADMYGNPYNFESFYTQEKVFDITTLGIITGLKIEFYQEPGTFKDKDNNLLPYQYENILYPANLFTENVYVGLGYDLNDFDKDFATLYTFNTSTYIKLKSDEENKKTVNLRWIHIDENDKPIDVHKDDSSLGDYDIRWYRYKKGSPSPDIYAGVDWEKINLKESKIFSCELIPDKTLTEEKLKAIILYSDEKYETKIITFTNEEEVPSLATKENLSALTIKCLDSTNGCYRIYGDGFSLLDSSLASILRSFEAHFDLEEYSSEEEQSVLAEAESIRWEIPVNSMMSIGKNTEDLPETTIDELGRETKISIKDGNYIIEKTPNEKGLINPLILYYINSYYTLSKSENWVTCSIIKDSIAYTTKKELLFGLAGTTGTDCTLRIWTENSKAAITAGTNDNLIFIAELYDASNEPLTISNNNDITIEWSWFKTSFSEAGKEHLIILSYSTTDKEGNSVSYNNKCEVKVKDENTPLAMDELYIIQCSVKGWGDYELIAYYPIAIRASSAYRYIQGATTLLYDTSGNITWYQEPYNVFYSESFSDEYGKWLGKTTGSWTDYHPTVENDSEELVYLPSIKELDEILKVLDENGNAVFEDDGSEKTISVLKGYRLAPLDLYVDNAPIYGILYHDTDGSVKWTLPILITLNKYPSSMINQWNGKELVIDLEDGTIMSTMVSAGYKDSDNKFYGVMMGNWKNSSSDSEMRSNTGIYGFNAGQMSFAFKDNGTAFIGKSGTGRIEFDGNNGYIKSSSYDEDLNGMKIDLNNGILDIHGKANKIYSENGKLLSLLQSRIKISPTNPYLQIVSENSNNLLYVGTQSYFLLSDAYTSEGTGFYLDLKNGYLKSRGNNGANFIAIDSNSSTTDVPFNISNKFTVAWNGDVTANTLYATNGEISGSMEISGTLYGGKIIGAIIEGSDISGSKITINMTKTSSKITLNGNTYICALNFDGGIEFYDTTHTISNDTTIDASNSSLFATLGYISGKDVNGTTTNFGILMGDDTEESSIIFESKRNIALRPAYHTFIEGDTLFLLTTNITCTTPAEQLTGIYARFA